MCMKEELRILLTDRGNKYGVYITLILLFFGLILFVFKLGHLPPRVPIFYNRPWGELQLGDPYYLFLFAIGSGLIFLVNITLAMRMYKHVPLLSRMLIWVAVLVMFLCITTLARILFLIT